jgi:hypothetical protein
MQIDPTSYDFAAEVDAEYRRGRLARRAGQPIPANASRAFLHGWHEMADEIDAAAMAAWY